MAKTLIAYFSHAGQNYSHGSIRDLPVGNTEVVAKNIRDTLHAYQMAKRCNEKRVMYECIRWGERGARLNDIAPGIIVTPLAYDEFAATGDGYQNMIDASAAERTGTSDEIAEAGAFLLGEHAGFITGTDLLIDGGVIASIRTGQYKLH